MNKIDIDLIVLFFVSVLGLAVASILFIRIARHFRIHPFRWSLSASYLLYLIIFFAWFNTTPPSTMPIHVLVPVALALPTSLLVGPFGRMFGFGDIGFFISLGCFGVIQYFLVGILVERIRKRKEDANITLHGAQ